MVGCFEDGSIEPALHINGCASGHRIDGITLKFKIFQALLCHGGYVGQQRQAIGPKHTQGNEFAGGNEGCNFAVESRNQLNLS